MDAGLELRSGLAEPQIPTIDGFRAIAVMLVILYHSGFNHSPGGLGVLIFFVISGFLVTWLMLKENARRGSVSLRRFYARRSLRIFPAFYAYALMVILALLAFHKPIHWPQTVCALLYVNNYYQALNGDPNTAFSHTWSLGVEEQFYLLWPALFLGLRGNVTRLITALALLIPAFWIYRAILQFGFHVFQGYFYEAFDTRLDHLLVGCLLAVLLFYKPESPKWSAICSSPWLMGLTVSLMVLSVALQDRFGATYRDSVGFIVDPLLTAILIPQAIVYRAKWFVGWLQTKPIRYLGRISYSLYLYQQIVIGPTQKLLARFPMPVQVIGAIGLLIVAASASFFFIEKPFLALKARRFHA